MYLFCNFGGSYPSLVFVSRSRHARRSPTSCLSRLRQVQCDPNGKPMPWLWVVLLPFIDEERLLSNLQPLYPEFTEEEVRRSVTPPPPPCYHLGS